MRFVQSLVCFLILLVAAPAAAQSSTEAPAAAQSSTEAPAAAQSSTEAPAAAQSSTEAPAAAQSLNLGRRFSFHLNAGYQAISHEFQQILIQRVYDEESRLVATNTVGTGPFGEFGGFVRVWRQLGVGATFSNITKAGTVDLTGTIPHPLLINNGRSVSFKAKTLSHRERSIHVQIGWKLDISAVEKLDLTIYAGPSFFNVTEGVLTGAVISEPSGPPFSTVRVDEVTQDKYMRNGWGGNVGLDVAYMWTTHVGFGGFARFTGGTVSFPSANGKISLLVGGFQSGGGLRFGF